ncbi:dipeptide epimerase [Joostella sp.]|uniref:dipeptide epimerase n=1 Tax=Joostella sp. TaxID=2231138 RepID=UPI003A9021A9
MEVSLKKYVLELEHTFSISRESHDFQDSLVVGLSLDGKTGYGEATANPYYKITVASMMEEIKAIESDINDYKLEKPEEFHAFLKEKGLSNFAICALDLACHDLYGKILGKPLHEIWGTSTDSYPITNYTIGIDSVEKMVEKMLEKPWPLYKVKLGTNNDIEIVKQLRENTDAIFRIDANNAWTPEQTLEFAPQLKELGVEFLEQPLPADNLEGYKQIIDKCVLPIIADESCIVEEDVDKCAGHFTGINIKLTKCGGLTPALRMIKRGKELGLKVMVGCMTESSVGISAIAQLTPQLDYVDMDGAMLLKHDIAKGVEILESGKLIFPTTGGTGVTLL